jgi:DNA modification methylase
MQSNTIYCGDCGHVLADFPEQSVDLIYVDPPFFSTGTSNRLDRLFKNSFVLISLEFKSL